MRIWLLSLWILVACKKNADRPSVPPPTTGSASADTAAPPAGDAAMAAATPDAAGGPAPVDEDKLLQVESIGPLKIGMAEADVVKALGTPAKKSKVSEEPATGLFVSNWMWDGAALHMGADTKKGPFKVASISVTKPPHATARGIKVGSTLAELSAAYPRTTEEGNDDPNMFLVGSVYGGLLFKLDRGAVAEIFLGAMAE